VSVWLNEELLFWSSGSSEVEDFQGVCEMSAVTTSAHEIRVFVMKNLTMLQGKGRWEAKRVLGGLTLFDEAVRSGGANLGS